MLSSVTFKDFSGGLDNRGNPADLAANETPDCSNVDLDQHGKVSKRRGSLKLFSANKAHAITWIEQFRLLDGTKKLIYAWGTGIYSCNIDGTSDTDNTGSLTLTSSQDVHFDSIYCTLSAAPIIVCTNGTDKIFYWAGSGSIVELSTQTYMPTAAKCVEWMDNYLILGNVKDRASGNWYPNFLTWSAVNAPNTWTSSDYIFIGSAVDPIIALIKFQKSLVVLKEHSVWRVISDPTDVFVPQIINPKIGCAARDTVAVTENNIIWLGEDGVYSYDGRGTDEESITKISDQLEAEAWVTNWHTSRKDKAHAVYYKPRNQYRIFLCEGQTQEANNRNETYYALHIRLNAWTKGKALANCSRVVQDGQRERLLVGDFSGNIIRHDYLNAATGKYVDTDDGAAIDAWWYSRDHDFGSPGRDKGWHRLRVVMNTTTSAQTLTVEYYVDFGDYQGTGSLSMQQKGAVLGAFILGRSVLGGGLTVAEAFRLNGYSDRLRLRFRNNRANEHFTLLAYTVEFESAETY